jgi:two-component system cell cycle response regulator DivK
VKSKRVLVADEHANSRELLRILLEHEGCEVSEASSGWQAVAVARATLPDLVLLDLDLVQHEGYETIREMRRDGRFQGRSIVAMADPRWKDGVEQAGFTGCISKPVVLHQFADQLENLLPGNKSCH